MGKKGREKGIYVGRDSVVVGMGIVGLRRRIVRWIRVVKKSLVFVGGRNGSLGFSSRQQSSPLPGPKRYRPFVQ